MKRLHGTGRGAGIIAVVLIVAGGVGCGPSWSQVRAGFYGFDQVVDRMTDIRDSHPAIVHLESTGTSFEGRPIMAARLGKPLPSGEPKPAVLAVFTEHGNEHDVTTVALGMLDRLASRYGSDERVTSLLDSRDLWIVPLMNPDGAEYDMSGRVPPLSWRKNRRPTAGASVGVDLNRNWGKAWTAPIPEELARLLANPDSEMYAGQEPFSESETMALRDFLSAHPEVRVFVDYHSGDAPFLQGGVLFPIPPDGFANAGDRESLESLADGFAQAMTSPADSRHAFVAIRDRDVAPTLRNLAPDDIRDSIPEHIPAAPGTSLEFVYGSLGRPALGVEIMRNADFFDRLPESLTGVIEPQCRGVVYLLEAIGNPALQAGDGQRDTLPAGIAEGFGKRNDHDE